MSSKTQAIYLMYQRKSIKLSFWGEGKFELPEEKPTNSTPFTAVLALLATAIPSKTPVNFCRGQADLRIIMFFGMIITSKPMRFRPWPTSCATLTFGAPVRCLFQPPLIMLIWWHSEHGSIWPKESEKGKKLESSCMCTLGTFTDALCASFVWFCAEEQLF